ncbi:MAG: STAS domain-containing protein [Planctomycetaceae bacterium]|jgi:hypothetical protein|nr:STAS domain-containing protein [Planctomycetaceae bacterium]
MDDQRRYERVRIEDQHAALVVYFNSSRIDCGAELEETGRELVAIVEVAASMRRPMLLSFRGVESISSALVGKLIIVHKKAKTAGVAWRLCEASPPVAEVFRRSWPGDGPAGVFAVPKPPPRTDGGRAYPEYDDEDA